MARRQSRQRNSARGTGAAIGGIALIFLALAALGILALFYFSVTPKPKLDAASLCPIDGPRGITVVLVDTSDDLPEPAQRQVLGLLEDQISGLPDYHKLDIRVLDIAGSRSRSLFSKCNPGDGTGLSEWTDNPRLARMRWLESFRQPAKDAIKSSLASAKSKSSPIMGAIQDIAIDQFSSAAAQKVEKKLIVISDMLEFTSLYSQYPSAGDLSYQRLKRSPAYLKFRTDLHDAHVKIEYVQQTQVTIDTVRHIEFWREWITDNKGVFDGARRLQGAR
ncbi:MAG: hypothetical protein ACLQDM_24905 [Bradyrhizobium sp.]